MQRYKDELMRQYQEREKANGFSSSLAQMGNQVEKKEDGKGFEISFGRKKAMTLSQKEGSGNRSALE